MGYMKIPNLYRDVRILEFKSIWALEKIHGTSAHIRWKDGTLGFFSGGEKYERFVELFDHDLLAQRFSETDQQNIVIYGEAYGAKLQRMVETYGSDLKFVAFDVKIGTNWLAVPQAAAFVGEIGLEFVHYKIISSDLGAVDAARDADSVQAVRNGMGGGHKREGVVLRSLFEVKLNNGERLIAKHKRDDFRETKTRRQVGVKVQVLTEAREIADEWVTETRLSHVLDKIPEAVGMEHTPLVLNAMVADVLIEGDGEFKVTKAVRKELGHAVVVLWKRRVKEMRRSEKNAAIATTIEADEADHSV